MANNQTVYAVIEDEGDGDNRVTRGIFHTVGLATAYAERLADHNSGSRLTRIEVEAWPVLTTVPDGLYPTGGETVRHVQGPVVVDADATPGALDS
jgi:hypothetical protein